MDLQGLSHPMLEGTDKPPAGDEELAAADAGPSGFSEVTPAPLDDQSTGQSGYAGLAAGPASADVSSVAAPVDASPRVLGCDVEVRERLRFLLWMRRLQGEKRSRTLETRTGG
jgi:hypothetical protein